MCTVTFMRVEDKYFITSTRDEKNTRKIAIPPASYQFEGGKIFFPKDGDMGGSWIAMHENGNAAVLLNGAFKKHTPRSSYRLSRGKILIHIIASENPVRRIETLSLEKIEPFTVVLIERGDLYECRWDGVKKHCKQLNTYKRYIWSSVTLYDEDAAKKRESWFSSFLHANPNPSQEDILHFHQFTGDGNKSHDLQMEQDDLYSTVSITGISIRAVCSHMTYLDLKENKRFDCSIELTPDYTFL